MTTKSELAITEPMSITGRSCASSQLVDDKKWKELVADIKKIVAKQRDGELLDEEGTRSDWHTHG